MSKRALLLLIAGVIAAFTAVSIRSRLNQAPPDPPPAPVVQTNQVIVAKRDLSPGTFVQSVNDLDWGNPPPSPPTEMDENGNVITPPEPYLREGSVRLTDFNGAVVRRPIHVGEPIPQNALMKSGEGGFMSAVLDQGMRAVSIAVTATSGNAGFISPGDHVDLIVTHHVKANSSDEIVSETFIHNVRVLAVDQMLENPDNKAILAKTVTVEVSPRQAEQVAIAEEMGKIAVALRSINMPEIAPKKLAEQPDGDARVLMDLYGNAQSANESIAGDSAQKENIISPHVQVIHGDKSESVEFSREPQ